MSQSLENVKMEAINKVLGTLGESMFAVLAENLLRRYKIDLYHDNLFTLEEFHYALSELLGVSGARLLTGEIHNELEKLATSALR